MKFVIKQTQSNSEYRWVLKANNGEVVADSNEGYKAKASCMHAIELIQKGAAGATVEDETIA